MSEHRSPGRLARDAVVLLAVGLASLTAFSLFTYRPGGPRWPHVVVDGCAWMLVLTTTAMLLTAAVAKVAELSRRATGH